MAPRRGKSLLPAGHHALAQEHYPWRHGISQGLLRVPAGHGCPAHRYWRTRKERPSRNRQLFFKEFAWRVRNARRAWRDYLSRWPVAVSHNKSIWRYHDTLCSPLCSPLGGWRTRAETLASAQNDDSAIAGLADEATPVALCSLCAHPLFRGFLSTAEWRLLLLLQLCRHLPLPPRALACARSRCSQTYGCASSEEERPLRRHRQCPHARPQDGSALNVRLQLFSRSCAST